MYSGNTGISLAGISLAEALALLQAALAQVLTSSKDSRVLLYFYLEKLDLLTF